MNDILSLEEFKLYESIKNNDTIDLLIEYFCNEFLNEEDNLNELEKSDIEAVKKSGRRGVGNTILRGAAWLLFYPIMIPREIVKYAAKKNRIKKLLKDEDNPIKKEMLKNELNNLKADQVKLLTKLKDAKEKAKEKADKLSDEEIQKNADKIETNKKEIIQSKEEIDKLKEEEKKIQDL